MLNSISRYLTLAALGVGAAAPPALAQGGFVFTVDGMQQHHFAHQRLAYRPARRHGYRLYADWHYRGANRRLSAGDAGRSSALEALIEQQAGANGVPASLVRRVITRESGGNPRQVSAGNFGLMQIRLGTARAMGYRGSAAGLLDPATNMMYAVRYLAGAYRAAGGNENRAVALYARGYRAVPVRRRIY